MHNLAKMNAVDGLSVDTNAAFSITQRSIGLPSTTPLYSAISTQLLAVLHQTMQQTMLHVKHELDSYDLIDTTLEASLYM